MNCVDVSINAGRVAAIKGWWQHYPQNDPEGPRHIALQFLEEAGGYGAPVSLRGTAEEVRALVAALVAALELVDVVDVHDRVDVLVHPPTADAVDP